MSGPKAAAQLVPPHLSRALRLDGPSPRTKCPNDAVYTLLCNENFQVVKQQLVFAQRCCARITGLPSMVDGGQFGSHTTRKPGHPLCLPTDVDNYYGVGKFFFAGRNLFTAINSNDAFRTNVKWLYTMTICARLGCKRV